MAASLTVRYTRQGVSLIARGRVVHRVSSAAHVAGASDAFALGWYGKPMRQFGFRFVPVPINEVASPIIAAASFKESDHAPGESRFYSVNASHVSPAFALYGAPVKVTHDRAGGFFADVSPHGCGKTRATPGEAIRELLADNACTGIRVAPVSFATREAAHAFAHNGADVQRAVLNAAPHNGTDEGERAARAAGAPRVSLDWKRRAPGYLRGTHPGGRFFASVVRIEGEGWTWRASAHGKRAALPESSPCLRTARDAQRAAEIAVSSLAAEWFREHDADSCALLRLKARRAAEAHAADVARMERAESRIYERLDSTVTERARLALACFASHPRPAWREAWMDEWRAAFRPALREAMQRRDARQSATEDSAAHAAQRRAESA